VLGAGRPPTAASAPGGKARSRAGRRLLDTMAGQSESRMNRGGVRFWFSIPDDDVVCSPTAGMEQTAVQSLRWASPDLSPGSGRQRSASSIQRRSGTPTRRWVARIDVGDHGPRGELGDDLVEERSRRPVARTTREPEEFDGVGHGSAARTDPRPGRAAPRGAGLTRSRPLLSRRSHTRGRRRRSRRPRRSPRRCRPRAR
jgi:hypothetical protein